LSTLRHARGARGARGARRALARAGTAAPARRALVIGSAHVQRRRLVGTPRVGAP